jgi:hypothetical protein
MAWTLQEFGICTDLHTMVISTQHEEAAGRVAEPSFRGWGGLRKLQTGPKRETLPTGRYDVVRGPERARGDYGGAPTRQASDAMDAGGLPRCRQAHGRQNGGQAPRQPQRARPGGACAEASPRSGARRSSPTACLRIV